jgi:hypothetical protein
MDEQVPGATGITTANTLVMGNFERPWASFEFADS